MDFQKIKNFFKGKEKPESFYEKTQREKRQKYGLPSKEDVYISKRWIKKTLLWKEKFVQKNPQYTNFFQKSLKHIAQENNLKHIMGFLWLFLIFLVVYITVFSSYFRISPSKILIEPLTEWIDTSIAQRGSEVSHGKSIFTLNEYQVAQNIKQDLQNIESIRIDKLFPNGIKILIKALPMNFDATVFGVDNKRFALSTNGVLVPIADLTNTEFKRHLQLVSPELVGEFFLWYKKILSDNTMLLITKIFELFEKEWTDLLIVEGKFFLIEKELHIVLESNTKIIFSLAVDNVVSSEEFSKNMLGQLVTLQTYIQENRAKLMDGSLLYVDARIPGKIFECPQSVNCKQNLTAVYGAIYEN